MIRRTARLGAGAPHNCKRAGLSSQPSPGLEQQLQRQLHVACRIRLPRTNPEISSINRRAGRTEDWRIRQVKCLCPELDLESLLDVEVLEQREIQVPGQILPNSSIGSRQIA